MYRTTPLAREALLSAGAAASLAALLVWLGPPGSDLAAHAYQRAVFLQQGFELWNNFWYAGRYSFITYSVLYYPLAALLGIRLLAVAVVIGREWGPTARWSSRTFAVVWAGIVLSAAFPFALGTALGLLAIWSLQAGGRWRFAALAALTLAASPLAFLLLALVLAGIALSRRADPRRLLAPGLAVCGAGLVQLLLTRAFPGGGHYPYPPIELAAACAACAAGAAVTWNVERARVLRSIFLVLLVASVAVYLVPTEIGENIARFRYLAFPLFVLAFSLRGFRPRWLAAATLALAVWWNVNPLAVSYARGSAEPAADAAYWQPAIDFLHANLTPSYRVEAVDTAGHWAAVYLPRAGIPLARGWFRQDDFPHNGVLYSELGPRAYLTWLRGLGIRYVVLTTAPSDYSARGEAALLRSGRSGLRPVLRTSNVTIFQVPRPRPIVTGPARANVLAISQSRVLLSLSGAGRYRIAFRYSPYWQTSAGCLTRGEDGMLRLTVRRRGPVLLRFDVDARLALQAVAGRVPTSCAA
ncbi:MAG: hypothetical protein M3321_09240 [Actinomycetota bacterium]|nr:hypothetical protein [Actinomycetota bacterium]